MFSKQNLLATLAGFVVMMGLGFAIWGSGALTILEEHTLTDVMKDPPDMLFLALSNLIAVFALSSIYGKWARGVHSAKEGFQFGVWIGIFAGIGLGLLWYATSEFMDLTGHLVNGVIEVIFYGIIGAVIAMVYKATAPKS